MNIYDFAGNEWEWTLERATSNTDYPCTNRGEKLDCSGSEQPASYRNYSSHNGSSNYIFFRSTLY